MLAPRRSQTQFHVLSFEGPDGYARAGGLASRISGLSGALAAQGFETHLWFVGDPHLPGEERRGDLTLHRWCQWISWYHPGGVYDGEEGKRSDYAASLPPFLLRTVLLPHLAAGGRAVVLAEEWHTADAIVHLDWLLRAAGLRDHVALFWNANNTFGFERVDWRRLASAATLTTVSRYMRYRMWGLGVDPVVIPNGLPPETLRPPNHAAVAATQQLTAGRLVLSKVARWDPDKRWLLAVSIAAALKRQGARPLLVARGGVEAHGAEVLAEAAAAGLRVTDRRAGDGGVSGLLQVLHGVDEVDVVNLRDHLGPDARQLLFRGSAVVLANSGHEPFGLVGLEAMAAGGVACIGATGEDYAVPGWNALVLQTNDPAEFLQIFDRLRANRAAERALRREGQATARHFAWPEIIARNLLPRIPEPPHVTSTERWIREPRADGPRQRAPRGRRSPFPRTSPYRPATGVSSPSP
jgi:glycosyltransferase involved in cell wall biosynthesis